MGDVIDFQEKKIERDKEKRIRAINNILEYAESINWDSNPRKITETLNMIEDLEKE